MRSIGTVITAACVAIVLLLAPSERHDYYDVLLSYHAAGNICDGGELTKDGVRFVLNSQEILTLKGQLGQAWYSGQWLEMGMLYSDVPVLTVTCKHGEQFVVVRFEKGILVIPRKEEPFTLYGGAVETWEREEEICKIIPITSETTGPPLRWARFLF